MYEVIFRGNASVPQIKLLSNYSDLEYATTQAELALANLGPAYYECGIYDIDGPAVRYISARHEVRIEIREVE